MIPRNREKFISLLIFIIILVAVSFALSINWYQGKGDNATYADITLSVAKDGHPTSQVLSTIIDYIFDSEFVQITPEEIKNLNLPVKSYEQNAFKFHFTPIQYLIAPFSWLIPIHIIWSVLTAFSFLGMLYLLYYFLREKGVSIIGSTVFLLIVVAHPAWNYSLFGQIYIDRLFLLAGTLLILSVSVKKPNIKIVTLVAILSALIIEKMIIITGMFLLAYSVLYWKRLNSQFRKQLFFLGLVLIAFAFIIIRYYLDNSYYSSFLTISSLLNFSNYLSSYPNAYANLITFLLFNLFLLLMGVFEWRFSLIAILMIVPNIFGNIGGAEKVGWETHYHSTYFPFLVWSAMLGYLYLYPKAKSNLKKIALYTTILTITLVTLGTKPLGIRQPGFSFSQIYHSAGARTIYTLLDATNPGGVYANQQKMIQEFNNTIPNGSIVSVPEDFMVYLFQNTKVYYYPLGLDEADYAVVWVNNLNTSPPEYSGFYSYLGSNVEDEIDTLLVNRMIDIGYDVYNPIIVGNVAIIPNLNEAR